MLSLPRHLTCIVFIYHNIPTPNLFISAEISSPSIILHSPIWYILQSSWYSQLFYLLSDLPQCGQCVRAQLPTGNQVYKKSYSIDLSKMLSWRFAQSRWQKCSNYYENNFEGVVCIAIHVPKRFHHSKIFGVLVSSKRIHCS